MEILIILLSLLVGGCAAPTGSNSFGTENVTFTLPTWQSDVYPSLDCWEIVISGKKVIVPQNTEIAPNHFSIPPEQSSFFLIIPKNTIVSVTARPVTKNSNEEQTLFFYPAGTVYPNLTLWNGKQAENTLTWEDGFTAKVIELIYDTVEFDEYSKKQIDEFVSRFNWKKFSETIFEKEKKSIENIISSDENSSPISPFFNPWQIDLISLIQKLFSKKINTNILNPKNIIALPLNALLSENKSFIHPPISAYVPENQNIEKIKAISVSTTETNYFLYNTDFLLLITATVNSKGEKKGSTEVVFLPKIVEIW